MFLWSDETKTELFGKSSKCYLWHKNLTHTGKPVAVCCKAKAWERDYLPVVPWHKVKASLEWLKNNKVNVLEWLCQSPDQNPSENLWHHIICVLHKFYQKE